MSKEKECNQCYWETICKKKKDEVCEEFSQECEICGVSESKFIKNGKSYCQDCVVNELEIKEVEFITYYRCGECVGDENDDFKNIVEKIDSSFKPID